VDLIVGVGAVLAFGIATGRIGQPSFLHFGFGMFAVGMALVYGGHARVGTARPAPQKEAPPLNRWY
jgi:hypothetical protein